jgi:hypothetical protein
MKLLRYFGSRMINLYLIKVLNSNGELNITENILRNVFTSIAEGCRGVNKRDLYHSEVLIDWNMICSVKPNILGLNTICSKTFNTYWTAFKNYHTYALFQHYKRYIAMKHVMSMKAAEIVATAIFQELKIKLRADIDLEYMKSKQDEYTTYINAERQEFSSIKKYDLNDLIKFHFRIINWLNSHNGKQFSIAPLCSMKIPFIELCKQGLNRLYKYSLKEECPVKLTDTEYMEMKPINTVKEFLNPKVVKKKRDILTFVTDGIITYLLWSKTLDLTRTVNKKQYLKYQKKSEEYKKDKQDKINEQIEKKGKADKRTTRKRPPKIQKNSNYVPILKNGLFRNKTGLYSLHALFEDCSKPETEGECLTRTTENSFSDDQIFVSIDPGHKNIETSSLTTLQDSDPKYHHTLGLDEYYQRIGNRPSRQRINTIKKQSKRIKHAELHMSKNSLKCNNYARLLDNTKVHVKNCKPLLDFYGSRNHCRRKFEMVKCKQRIFKELVNEIAPDPNTIIVLGNAKFATVIKGLSACPIAKLVKALSKERRVLIVPEPNTTKMCSYCRCSEGVTVQARSNRLKKSVSGKKYRIPIHGLRHCTKCSQCLNRDKNASRCIFYSFKNYYLKGCLPFFLRKKGCNTEHAIHRSLVM